MLYDKDIVLKVQGYILLMIRMVVLVLILSLLPFYIFGEGSQDVQKFDHLEWEWVNARDTFNERINPILREAHAQIRDLNGDGKINCNDYAVMFKLVWDKYYPPHLCTLVVNHNYEDDWHHLFPYCIFNDYTYIGKKIEVEATVFDLHGYKTVEEVFGDAYKEIYNEYDKTEKFLKECNAIR